MNTIVATKTKSPKKAKSYICHEIAGVEREVSMKSLGRVATEDLQFLKALDVAFYETGWPEKLEKKDLDLCSAMGIDPEIVKYEEGENAIVSFSGMNVDQKKAANDLFVRYFPEAANWRHYTTAFRSYFAHPHKDHVDTCRAQVMIITSNPFGHRLYSVDAKGEESVFVPSAGDIVFLDTRCLHAVMPVTEGHDLVDVRQNPMEAFFMCFGD